MERKANRKSKYTMTTEDIGGTVRMDARLALPWQRVVQGIPRRHFHGDLDQAAQRRRRAVKKEPGRT